MKHLYQEINDALYNTYYGINRIEEEELKKSQFKDLTVKELHAIDAITMYDHLTVSQVADKLHLSRATNKLILDICFSFKNKFVFKLTFNFNC